MNIEEANKKYKTLTSLERISELYKDFDKVLLTSSFGTTSAILLHMFHQVNPEQAVYFINTTYLFPETIEYKNLLSEKLQLRVVELLPEEWKNKFTRDDQTWSKNPDFCCSINKVEPIEQVKKDHEVWVSGLLSYQNEHRKHLDVFEQKNDLIKFYPIINLTEQEVNDYMKQYDLPFHPLQADGYDSVGCTHCTVKGKGRAGRWIDSSKTECGLHL
jgi:phosphoadenosine phosphosulfate reductase